MISKVENHLAILAARETGSVLADTPDVTRDDGLRQSNSSVRKEV